MRCDKLEINEEKYSTVMKKLKSIISIDAILYRKLHEWVNEWVFEIDVLWHYRANCKCEMMQYHLVVSSSYFLHKCLLTVKESPACRATGFM